MSKFSRLRSVLILIPNKGPKIIWKPISLDIKAQRLGYLNNKMGVATQIASTVSSR